MKFAALALTLLLAVGSHGDVWPGDHLKAALPRVQAAVERVVDSLSGTEYEREVPEMKQRVTAVFGTITGFLDSDEVKSAYDTAKARSDEITRRWQASGVRATLVQRAEEYKTLLSNFYETNRDAFENLKIKLVETITRNHEATGQVLKEAAVEVYQEVQGHVANFGEMIKPYYVEYAEQIKAAVNEAQKSNLRETIAPKVADIRAKIAEIYGDILTEVNKQ